MREKDWSSWVRADERPIVRRWLDLAHRVERTQQPVLTDFLSPREQYLIQSVAASVGVTVHCSGGYPDAERQRALLAPEWWVTEAADFRLEAVVAKAAGNLRHGQVLGALLGLGIDRRKVGDVGVAHGRAQVIVDADILDYILSYWHTAGREALTVTAQSPTDLVWDAPKYQWQWFSLASPRVDAVVAAACRWPRGKAKEWVERGLVSLNFSQMDKPDEEVAQGDILSVRSFGRIAVGEQDGSTQRGRERWLLGILKS
ncbi:RNA-binding protein [Alicyclobacillus herbarius]|uniref:YlmH family RNA-binding protein n=1 Tax=Alicyclobacillus herbarius TaxID=122960 RepID=UPI000413E831|nr:YlmH/Sll1252 family protein [Alicyclobacillus herbarius]